MGFHNTSFGRHGVAWLDTSAYMVWRYAAYNIIKFFGGINVVYQTKNFQIILFFNYFISFALSAGLNFQKVKSF